MTTDDRPLSVFHGTRMPYPEGDRIERLVARRAAERPDAAAVRSGGTELTYRRLVAEAQRVAARLAAAGVRHGDVVAVRAARAPETVSVLLGIMWLGAAYACAPLDWPESRYHAVVRRTGARLCVADTALDAPAGLPTLLLGELLDGEGRAGSVPQLPPGADGTEPCCVFFTSGSTGEPKAASAPHRGVVRTALDPAHALTDRPMVSLQAASAAWDVFALELWVPLLRGGTCVIHPADHLTGPQLRAYTEAGVNTLALSATSFNAVLDDDPDALSGVRLLLTGGARASAQHLERCRSRHPGLRLVNAYGPVENTITSVRWTVEGDIPDDVPIGGPVVNTSIYLLDQERRPVPLGETGELAIGGHGLSSGYLGNEAESRRRFAVLDLPEGPQRVYLTGDLARADGQGRIRFVGRRDRQLKIRGLRIEAEEIERLIEAVPGVDGAFALALPLDAVAKTHLAACYTTVGAEVPAERVRLELAEVLPGSFVPDVLLALDDFPCGANGKVDQQALAALVGQATGSDDTDPDPEAPSAVPDMLRTVAETVAALLGRPVGARHDIFRHGATSLTAVRIATRLGNQWSRQVDPADVLLGRTPQRIAELVAAAVPFVPGTASGTSRVEPGAEYRPARVPAQQAGFWSTASGSPQTDEDVTPMAYRLRGPVDADVLTRAVDAVVGRHEALRARFSEGGRNPRVLVLAAGQVKDLLERHPVAASFEEARRNAEEWMLRPFDLGGGLPVRAGLFPVGEDEALFAVAVHHIAFDACSGPILLRDLERAYEALRWGRPAFTDPAPGYYRAAAEQADRYRADYPLTVWDWITRTRDAPELRFPVDRPRPAVGPAVELPLRLGEQLGTRIGRAAEAAGTTGLAVVLAAYVQLLRALTGASEPAVGVACAGRFTEETAAAVGCLASVLPLRLPGSAVTAAALVEASAERLRAAMRPPPVTLGETMPEPPAGYARHPLLQAHLLQVEQPPPLRFGGATAEPVRTVPGTAVAELTLELWPTPAYTGVLRYRPDAIAPEHASRLAEELTERIARIVEDLCPAQGSLPSEETQGDAR